MKNKNKKWDVNELAKLILSLYDEADKNHIIALLDKNEDITPEVEQAIDAAFKKQIDAMEEELDELKAARMEFAEYREGLEVEAADLEKELDQNSLEIKTELNDFVDGVDGMEEEFKVDENQSQIEALRNKLLNK